VRAKQHVDQKEGRACKTGGIGWKAVLRFAIFTLSMPLVLFVSAGQLDWVMGWIFVGLLIAFTAVSRVLVYRKNPELLAERARSLEAEDVKGWDRVLVALVALYGPLATLVVAGLDRRFDWPPTLPLLLQLVSLALVVLGYSFSTWAMVENEFFSAVIRIQKDRDQTVVTTGPYQFVRHPAYAGGIAAFLATPLMLNALWALIPAGLVAVGTVLRTLFEDRTLLEELNGYAAYAQRVRYRLVPGVW
jgi:protein-S-isoprenylcysteine O-methyltransferase Ste14